MTVPLLFFCKICRNKSKQVLEVVEQGAVWGSVDIMYMGLLCAQDCCKISSNVCKKGAWNGFLKQNASFLP